jgi:hypothetical protein
MAFRFRKKVIATRALPAPDPDGVIRIKSDRVLEDAIRSEHRETFCRPTRAHVVSCRGIRRSANGVNNDKNKGNVVD